MEPVRFNIHQGPGRRPPGRAHRRPAVRTPAGARPDHPGTRLHQGRRLVPAVGPDRRLAAGWVWRFRPEFWHRTNALVLIGMLLLLVTRGAALHRGSLRAALLRAGGPRPLLLDRAARLERRAAHERADRDHRGVDHRPRRARRLLRSSPSLCRPDRRPSWRASRPVRAGRHRRWPSSTWRSCPRSRCSATAT